MKHSFKYILFMMLLFFAPVLSASAISGSYTAEASRYLTISPGVFTDSSVIGFKLGRFEINNPDRALYNPAILISSDIGHDFYLSGLYRNWEGGTPAIRPLKFNIISVAYPNGDGGGGTPVLQTIYDSRRPVIDWGGITVTANPFVVDLYLVNTNSSDPHNSANLGTNGQLYSLGTPYFAPNNFNPIARIAVADEVGTDIGTYAPGNGSYISEAASYITENGSSSPIITSILNPGGFTTDPDGDDNGFFYGDGPVFPTFFFNFLEPTTSFVLSSAIGPGRVTVNEARIEVQNGVAGELYSQHLTFSDTSTDPSFQLYPAGSPGLPISYKLFLGTEPITKGQSVLWSSLVPGINSRDLKIGGILASNVASLASGSYQGIISVIISNPN